MKLPEGQAKLSKNLLFLHFHHPKLQINMPFIYSKSVEKEQGKHTAIFVMRLEWMKFAVLNHTFQSDFTVGLT